MTLNNNSKQDIIEESKNNINNISNNNESKAFSNPFESNSKSRNNKSNLKYQSSDELIKIAMQKGKKQNQETPGKSNVNINFSQNIKDIPPFAKNLPVSVFHTYQFNNKNVDKTCSICLEEFIIGKTIVTLPCFHFFHVKCISDWLKKQNYCPICLTEIIFK